MSVLVQPRLVDGPFGDPALLLDFRHARRAILFDLGDLTPLAPRELGRVSHAFVSHAHMDHVAGLDRLLRLRLHRPGTLDLVGPRGFVAQMEHRLRSFTWNLLDERSMDFRLRVSEFDGVRVSRAAEFRAREAFARREIEPPVLPEGSVLEEEDLAVRAALLEHSTPSLAFTLRERIRVNVWRSALDALGLPVGPWLNEAKRAARSGAPDARTITVGDGSSVPLGLLRERALRLSEGRAIAYATDAADTASNRARIVRLAEGVDHLYIEAVFLEADRPLAEATRHLTARAAGEIAREAGARRVTGFHHSARYAASPGALAEELQRAFERPAPGA